MRHVAIAAVLAAGCSSGGGGDNAEPPRILDGKVNLRLQSTEEFLSHSSVRYRSGQDLACDEFPDQPDCAWTELLTEDLLAGDSLMVPDFPEGKWVFEMVTRFGTCTKIVQFTEEETDPATEEYVLELCG